MKKFVALSAVAAMAIFANASEADDIAKLKEELSTLKEQLTAVKIHDANDNVKLSIDFRSSYDNIQYETAGTMGQVEEPKNVLLSNRLIIGMEAQPVENLTFKGSLAVNKVFGHNNYTAQNGFNNYDWFGTVTPDDNTVRLREAYFVWFGSMGDIDTTFSVGRRPSLNGSPTNLRDDDRAASPNSHNINMEFDGASYAMKLENVVGVSGMSLKFCAGRGYSNSQGKYNFTTAVMVNEAGATIDANQDGTAESSPISGYPSATQSPYAENEGDTPNMDMFGFIFVPYDDGQYSITTNYSQAWNLLGIKNATDFYSGFQDAGDMETMAATFMAKGIGEFGVSDFLDDTKVFVSYASSITHPKDGVMTTMPNGMGGTVDMEMGMLGSTESKTGHSIYAGIQIPDMISDGKIGFEYNKGSKYWRSFTYGEDTMIGSKLAARGTAMEVYYKKPLIGEYLTLQVNYTTISYDYTGSDMFFGASGMPVSLDDVTMTNGDPVEKASDLRVAIRYRY